MAPKHKPQDILNLVIGKSQDFDLQAGSPALPTSQAAARYLKSPGHFLALLRFYRQEEVNTVANATQLTPEKLTSYEKGYQTPSLKDLSEIAKYYGASLRSLLEIFGHVSEDAASASMGIAANFAGQLNDDEKVSLQQLVQHYTGKVKPKRKG